MKQCLSTKLIAKILFVVILFSVIAANGQQIVPAKVTSSDNWLSTPQESLKENNNEDAWALPKATPPTLQKGKIGDNIAGIKESNFTSFSKRHTNKKPEVAAFNKGYENNPELGVLFANAPCGNCYELLEKRTPNQKYFVEEGSNGTKFILQTGARPLHFKDNTGKWKTVTDHLAPQSNAQGVFATEGRDVNISINSKKGFSTLTTDAGSITYNKDLELIFIQPGGKEQSLGKANWSNYTAGDDGVIVKDAWAGIDLEMGILLTGLKTNFIIKNAMPAYAAGTLVLRDNIVLGKGMKFDATVNQPFSGVLSVSNNSGTEVFTMQQAIAYEKNDAKNTIKNINYNIVKNTVLDIEIPGSLLSKSASSYPLVIDPLVSGNVLIPGFSYNVAPLATATTFCVTTLNVTIPAAATLTDIKTTYSYKGINTALWNQSGVIQTLGTCNTALFNCGAVFATGLGALGGTCNWPLTSYWGTFSACVPAFSCSSYPLTFTLSTVQDYAVRPACDATVFASATNYTVQVFGSSAIAPTISPAGGGTICMPGTITLTGSPLTGGTWVSSNPGAATVSGTTINPVVVTGAGAGTTNISYTAGGCTAVKTITVSTAPTITGTTSICYTGSPSDTTDLTGAPAGGTWSSGTPGVATVSSTTANPVTVTAAGSGTSIITYNDGICSATVPVNVSNGTTTGPSAQPTALVVSGISTTGATINFTTTTATGYLVVVSTSPTLSATPVNDTVYTTGSAFGGGIVINGSSAGSTPAYTTSILNSNTNYYVFVYAFNINCVGPQYNITSPLTGSFATCIKAPTGLTTGTIGVNTVILSWTASAVGGGYISPINYTVQAYTDAGLTTLVTGYPVVVGAVTTYTAIGLSGGVQYYFTVTPLDACSNASNTVTATTVCGGTASIPYLETFDASPVISYLTPDCMGADVSPGAESGVQNNITYGTTPITADHTSGAGGYFYTFPYNGYYGPAYANQWLLTPGLACVAGTQYKVSFWYRTTGGITLWQSIKMQYSQNGTVPLATSGAMAASLGTLAFQNNANNTAWVQLNGTFTPVTSGTYYVGIDAASLTGSNIFMAIDDIEICAVPTGVTASNATAPYCAPATIDFSSTGTNVTAYTWSGPGGFTSSLTNPVLISTITGTSVYTLTGTNDPPGFGFGGYCALTTTTTLTVNPTPNAITGLMGVCVGGTTPLSTTSTLGTWTCTPTTVATISPTGVVTGISAGTATVSYSFTAGPCAATAILTVSPGPPTIAIANGGLLPTRCAGINSSLVYTSTNSPLTYSLTWAGGPYAGLPNVPAGTPLPSSPITIVDLIGLPPTVYTGTITVTNYCGTATATVTLNIVTTVPPIAGNMNICVGATSDLTDAASGGIWSSSNPLIASVGMYSGVLTGVAPGTTALISYSAGAGCGAAALATVNLTPVGITGPSIICLGGTGTLNDATALGTWTSQNTLVATIGAGTGIVTGILGGVDTITYSLGSCYAIYPITVEPAIITGTMHVCQFDSVQLLDAIGGGVWSSTTSTIATVNPITGYVTGVLPGTDIIAYTIAGCTVGASITVNPSPTPITGIDSVCRYATTTLTETVGGGVWSSVTGVHASVVGGVVTGVLPGIDSIKYTITTGADVCMTWVMVTVNPAPVPITGTLTVCQFATTLLADATGLGIWSVSNATASVSAGGLVTGLLQGTDTISYSIGSCYSTVEVTVNTAPTAITGILTLCRYSTTTLGDAVGLGVWSSVTVAVATVNPATGVVYGVAPGTSVISYTIGSCTTTVTVTVDIAPLPITGTLTVCETATTLLSDLPAGGVWSTSNTFASVSGGGLVTGLVAGTDTISYTIGSCYSTVVVTVYTMPAAITGTLVVCQGATTPLGDITPGGLWLSVTTAVATVDPTGVVTGMSLGTSVISYYIGTCTATAIVTVHIAPNPVIGGNVPFCTGGTTITLTNTTAGGTWSGTAPGIIASVNPVTGAIVSGATAGTAIITYSTGCAPDAYATVTVNTTPTAILGNTPMCTSGAPITLTDGISGGTWSGGAPVAGVGPATGIVTPTATQGISTIVYTIPGCVTTATVVISVNNAPAAIGGNVPMCTGGTTITLTNTALDGTWSGGTVGIATVNPVTGVVTSGGTQGTTVIIYTNNCGSASVTVTVNTTPVAILGNTPMCTSGAAITLTDASTGGTWSGGGAVAIVGATTGIVTPTATQGTGTIVYTTGCGAPVNVIVTVNAAPAAIGGNVPLCVGGTTITLTNTSTGGTWGGGTVGIATVNPATGVVTPGGTPGTTTVDYTNNCGTASVTVTVNITPTAIGGNVPMCTSGAPITLTDGITGGTWSGGAPVAGVGPASGIVTPTATQGISTIVYTVAGCVTTATVVISVNNAPAAIGGNAPLCTSGTTITLTNTALDGTWGGGTVGIATVNPITGVVTPGATPGTTTIDYTNNCGTASVTITVNTAPVAIVGNTPLCTGGATITLTDGSLGGSWSGGGAVATVGATTGIVTPTATQGTGTIVYTTGCGAPVNVIVTVNAAPAAIGGNAPLCTSGTTITLTNTSTGGVWGGGTLGIATVNPATGVVTPDITPGIVTISYTNNCGTATINVTVNTAPVAIVGNTPMCTSGASITLTEAMSGGTWSGGAPVASVGATTGIVTPTAVQGTATIVCTTGCGSPVSVVITVNAAPAAIGGNVPFCTGGSTISLTNTSTGGSWSGGAVGIATVNPITGIVTSGTSAGTVTVDYINNCGSATTTLTINTTPSPITGLSSVCVGNTITLSDAVGGGVWSSSATTQATVNPTGVVTGVAQGTPTIMYNTGCGAPATLVVTVNAAPVAITGTLIVCVGSVTDLTDASTGGNWISGNTPIATVIATGAVTGVAQGTSIITYTNGCGPDVYATVTVNALPSAIGGNVPMCAYGSTITLTNTASDVLWSGGTVGIASINALTGVVTPQGQGTAIITCSNGCGSGVTAVVTVNNVPAPITGTFIVCNGSTITLSDASTGGTWTSSATTIATVNPATGVVTGVGAGGGTTTITYDNGCSPAATAIVTVNIPPAAITGNTPMCTGGSTITLSNTITGGVWSGGATNIASVNPLGIVTSGSLQGTATISYSTGCGTSATVVVTVNAPPAAITGTLIVCVGSTTNLANTSTGGIWTSGTTIVATVNPIGHVTGLTHGTSVITYSNGCGSYATATVTVNAPPAPITGNVPLCTCGSTLTLSDAVSGGTWSGGTGSIGTISGTGVVTSGCTQGTTIISYSTGCGTAATVTVTVNRSPSIITGILSLCAGGATTTAHDSATGGTWSGGFAGLASIDPVTGIITSAGSTGGNATITFTNGCGSPAYATITVNPLPLTPAAITGANHVCIGDTIIMSDATLGGTWSSVYIGKATISAIGVVTGVSGGVDTIKYTETNSCGSSSAVKPITIYPLPVVGTISGPTSICIGTNATFTDTASGGTWHLTNYTNATISSSGVVTSVHIGPDTVIYLVPSTYGCYSDSAKKAISIDTFPVTPALITGITIFCQASTITLSDASTGYNWSSSDTTIAKIDSVSGVVTGMGGGIVTITYTNLNACGFAYVTYTDTVKPLPAHPAPITGTPAVCMGLTTTLADTTSAGVWLCSNTSVATVDGTGVVSAVSPGVVIISYAVTNSCGGNYSFDTVTVYPQPLAGPITGVALVCAGVTSTFTDSIATGVWSSGNTLIATVSSTGLVTGVSAGTVVIYNTDSNYCGIDFKTDTITVHPAPFADTIFGPSTICIGNFRLFTDSVHGGTWSTDATAVFSIDGISGYGYAGSVGNAIISYSVTNECGTAVATDSISVLPLPTSGTITGDSVLCVGASTVLTETSTVGVWSASNSHALATDSLITGVSAGIDSIFYTVTTFCGTSVTKHIITINPLASAGLITGNVNACIGLRDTFLCSATGGTWSLANTKATIDATGVVTGVIAGLDTVKYTVVNSCSTDVAIYAITINPLPNAGIITGDSTVCVASNIVLSSTVSGGSWTSVNLNASVSGGVVHGLIAGTDSVIYVVSNICGFATAIKSITVNPLLNPGVITGLGTVCPGVHDTLTDTTTGGVWSNITGSVTVSATGVVTGVSAGIDTILYSLTNMCGIFSAILPMTINPSPFAGVIYNTDIFATYGTNLCIGATIHIKDSTAGGTWAIKNSNATMTNDTGGTKLISGIVSGMDTIYYMVTNICGTDTAIDTFHIYPLPYLIPIRGYKTLCKGALDTLNDFYSGGSWTSSNTAIATIDLNHGYETTLSAGLDTMTFTCSPVNGCINSVTFKLTVLDTPDFKITNSITDIKCFGTKVGKIDVSFVPDTTGGSVGPFTWVWSNGDSAQNISRLDAGRYFIEVAEPGKKCARSDSFTVTQPDSVVVTINVKNDTCKTNNGAIWISAVGGVSPYTYAWSNASTDTIISNLPADTYTVTVTDQNSCVQIIPIVVEEGVCNDIVIHNALTPNGDGYNDFWIIEGIMDYPNNTIQIFDKWGDVVYEMSHYINNWDGHGKDGKYLPSGTYFYILKLNEVNGSGKSNVKTGSILIKQ